MEAGIGWDSEEWCFVLEIAAFHVAVPNIDNIVYSGTSIFPARTLDEDCNEKRAN